MKPDLRDYIPSVGLGLTQILGYGSLMYAYAVLLPRMADHLDLSLSTVFGILSLGLFFGGLVSPVAGMLVDRFGGRWVMTLGSIGAGLALMSLSQVSGRFGLFLAILLAEGAGMFVLYNVAFAAIMRIESRVPAARAISIIALFGGVASTIFWPLTLSLANAFGWQSTWITLGLMVLLICTPLHFILLEGPQKGPEAITAPLNQDWPELQGAVRQKAMLWMILSFVFSGYVMGAVMTLWVSNVQTLGHTAATAAFAGAMIGPFKTVGRGFEMLVSRNLYPLVTYAMSLGLMMAGFILLLGVGASFIGLLCAAALYGMGDGIKTIARGTLPLALFGQQGYGARLGWMSFVQMAVNASAPFTFAYLAEQFGGWWSFAAMAACLCFALATYFLIPDPRRNRHVAA